jgi:glycyl-tRNA synthetase
VFGFGEINGTHARTDYDLTQHQNVSGVSMLYTDPETNEKYVPYVIEPSVGVERSVLMVLCDAYNKEQISENDMREVMKFHPYLAPYKCCVLPLVKKYHTEKAMEVYRDLCKYFSASYDESGSIGKRYRRQDAIGTPFCITVDDETINEGIVTIRNRDTMEQIKLSLDEIEKYIQEGIEL